MFALDKAHAYKRAHFFFVKNYTRFHIQVHVPVSVCAVVVTKHSHTCIYR